MEIESLARVLAVNSTLEELDISNNNIGDKGIGHIGIALLTNTTLKMLCIGNCVPVVPHLYTSTGSNHMNGICTALQKNTTLKTLNVSFCGMSDLVAESLARALEVNSTLEELVIIDKSISDNGMVHIAKSLQKNNTLKFLHVRMEQCLYHTGSVTGFTDTGVLTLARGVATNTSIEHLSMQWSSTDPERTLKVMAESVKNSNLKTLSLTINTIRTLGEAPAGVHAQEVAVSPEKASEWYHGVEVGGKQLIMALEDSHLESLQFASFYERPLQLQTAIDSINSARHKKGLPNIHFTII